MNDDEIRQVLEEDVTPPGPHYWERIDANLAQIASEPPSSAQVSAVRHAGLGARSGLRGRNRWWGSGRRIVAVAAAVAIVAVGGVAVRELSSDQGSVLIDSGPSGEAESTASPSPDSSPQSSEKTAASTSTGAAGPKTECGAPTRPVSEIKFDRGEVSGSVKGRVLEGGEAWYRLGASAGQRMIVEFNSTVGGATVDVFTPDGVLLAGAGGVGGKMDHFALPESGDYQICVSPAAGDIDYEVAVTITGPVVTPESRSTGSGELAWTTVPGVEEIPDQGAGRHITIEKLVFSGSAAAPIEELNRAVDDLVAAERAQWLAQVDELGQEQTSRPETLEITSELTLWTGGLVSVRIDVFTDWSGSAYPVWWSRAVIYDLDQEAVLTLDDLVSNGRQPLYQLVAAAVVADYDADPGLLRPEDLDDAAFALRPEGLEVSTGRGRFLASPYPGSVSILPWAQLDGLIDPTLEARASAGIGESTATPGIN